MTGPKRGDNNQALTVYLADGAVSGQVTALRETELVARMGGALPQAERLRFLLQLQGGVLAGELTCIEQTERICRLQFAALTPSEQARLAPFIEVEE